MSMDMVTGILLKIRSLTNDLSKPDSENFVYTNSKIFTIIEPSIISVTKVEKNGADLGVSNWSYSSATNQVTITSVLASGDIVEIFYTYYKRSNTELKEFIRGALAWISIYSIEGESDYEYESDDTISPTPPNKTADLIAIISAILINPDYNRYSLPTISVIYNNRISKEDKIEKLINRFRFGIGTNSILEWN